ANYNLLKSKELGLPADKNGEGVIDAATHLKAYQVKEAAGTPKFAAVKNVQISNQCTTLRLEAKTQLSLMVPTNKSLIGPVSPPGSTHVDHYLCYQTKQQ